QGNDALEPPLTRDVELGTCQLRVVLHDQHDAVPLLDLVAVVTDLAREEHRWIELRLLRRWGRRRRAAVALGVGCEYDLVIRDLVPWPVLDRLVPGRQEERERAAPADLALDVDLAAEQS